MFEAAERLADAVLYEGYVLYPYRASSVKNRLRWQFGVIAPRAHHDDGEPWFAQTECVVSDLQSPGPTRGSRVHVRLRCLRPTRTEHNWLDGAPVTIDLPTIELAALPLVSECALMATGISARVTIHAREAGGFVVLRLRLENLEPWQQAFDGDRDAMLTRALVGAHVLLGVDGGRFVSLLEPPPDAAAIVAGCDNRHAWPVLVGDRASCDVMLSSPIVLYDFPAVAKESRGDLCDAAEIDEILSLRILTLTDDEKAQARETDPRACRILDQVEALSPDGFASLHGTMRSADFFNPPGTPSPETASATVGGVCVTRGSRVRLRPNRRADAMDMFLAGQPATVAGIYRDVDDRVYVAVTVDADPAAAMHESFGRYFYFDPSEVEPLCRPGLSGPSEERI